MSDETPVKIKQPPVLFNGTKEIIHRLAGLLDGVLITYWNSPSGSVCDNDVVAVHQMLERIGRVERLYLFIRSEGGDGQAALRIVHLLRQYARDIIALIPLECASAATMIALGANELHMGPMAHLTAIDTSLTHPLSPVDRDNERVSVSLDELKRVIGLWDREKQADQSNPYQALFAHVHPLVIGAVDRADSLSIMLCKEILSYHIADEAVADRIAQTLNTRYPSHSYPILSSEARRLGLRVRDLDPAVHNLLIDLNLIYNEMGQRAVTDFSEIRSHNNEILNIIETRDVQLYFQTDKDWFYRTEERRWVPLNDNSCWRLVERIDGKIRKQMFHLA